MAAQRLSDEREAEIMAKRCRVPCGISAGGSQLWKDDQDIPDLLAEIERLKLVIELGGK